MKVSTDGYVTIEYWKSSLIRIIFIDYLSKLEAVDSNYFHFHFHFYF